MASPTESPSAEPTPETMAQQMDRVAQEAFGAEGAHPVGEVQKPFTTSQDAADVTVQQYQGGVVMHTACLLYTSRPQRMPPDPGTRSESRGG